MNHTNVPFNQIQQHSHNLEKGFISTIHSSNEPIDINHNFIPKKEEIKLQNKSSNPNEKALVLNQEEKAKNNGQELGLKSNEEIRMEVKRWEKERKSIQNRRDEQLEMLKSKLFIEDKKIKEEAENKKEMAEKERKEKVQENIELIKERKRKRLELLSEGKEIKIKEPLFIQKEKEFINKKISEEQKLRIIIKNKKQQMIKEMEELSNHEINFLKSLKERKSNKSKSIGEDNESDFDTSSKVTRAKSDFNLHLKKGEHLLEEYEKVARRKEFERKLKNKIISIDIHKAKEALIAKDRTLNPLKYNYLSSASALTNERIYDEFKDFELKTDRKKIGNEYLKEVLANRPEASRIRSISESNITKDLKPEYKNYIPEVKSLLKRQLNKQPHNEVEEIIFKYDNNSDRLANLNKKSNYYQNEAVKRIKQMKSNENSGYSEHLHEEKIIDDLYMKSIKMKIASAQFIS